MELLSPFHLLVILAVLFLFFPIWLVPIYRIVARTGHSGWFCLLAFVPVANVIFLWVLAFVRWPAVDRGA